MSNGATDYRILVALSGITVSLMCGALAIAANLALSRIAAVEREVALGILPRSEERIISLEARIERLEAALDQHLSGNQ